MTDSDTQPNAQDTTLAHAEMEAAVEALAETEGQSAPAAPQRRKRRQGSAAEKGDAEMTQSNGMSGSGAEHTEELRQESRAEARAGSIHVRQGAIGRAEADSLDVTQGAVGMARAEHVALKQGACGLTLGSEVRLEQSFGRLVAARETVSLHTSGAWNVLADKVEMHPGSGVMFLIARRVEGDVRPVFDWRGALAFGAAMGLVGGLIGRRRR